MFIQGNLQVVFDALYEMGVINPTLKADWAPADKAMKRNSRQLQEVVRTVNQSKGNVQDIIEGLKKFDQETLMYLAMEVAREYVDYEDRKVIH
jgi:hypothetical protein